MVASHFRLPSIDGLLAFEAAARHGTFERAAGELCMTGSAVAKRVATVEQLLGVQLLTRSAKALALTPTGKEYLDHVRGALGLLAAVPLHQRACQKLERLRVCAPPTFARQILVPNLEEFTLAHPDVELEVVLSIPYMEAAATDADLWIRNGDPVSMGGTALLQDCVTPLAAPSLLRRVGPIREPADLASVPLLRTPVEPWAPWFRIANLAWAEPTRGPKLLDLGLLLEAAVSGQGVALGRPTLARHWLATGALVPLFSLTAQPSTPYYLMPHVSDGAAEAFSRWLRGVCERAVQEVAEFFSRRS